MTTEQYFQQFAGTDEEDETPVTIFEITTEDAADSSCDTQNWTTGIPKGYEYLSPILEHREFSRLQFTVEYTRVTIRKVN